MVLILNKKDIEHLVSMEETILAMEKVFLEFHEGKTVCPVRLIIDVDKHKGLIYYMPSYLSETESLAIKIVAQYEENLPKYGLPTILASILLSDPKNGRPLALMEGGHLTALRTGAVSGVATKYLARRDSTVVGVIGTGAQARTQILAMSKVLKNMERVRAYDQLPGRVEDFAKEISRKIGLEVKRETTSRECVEDSDVLIVATTSKSPVLNGNWIGKGTHINSVGVVGPEGRELDDKTVEKAKIVVDTLEGALVESGDLSIPLRKGVISRSNIYAELHEIISGEKPGRTSDDEITCWKAVGLAIEDAAVAKLVYDKARKEGIGTEVEI